MSVTGTLKQRLPFVGATFLSLLVVSGCAGTTSPGAGEVDATLAQTKSVAQLLRNEAASRLPHIVVKDVNETLDVSEACESVADDPEGLVRSWLSSTTILLTNSQAARITTVSDSLAESFVDQGWTQTHTDSDNQTLIALESETSLARIEFSVEPKVKGQEPAIRISATGPCVQTAGTNSDEVKKLEGRD
jgi:hypothetical protein